MKGMFNFGLLGIRRLKKKGTSPQPPANDKFTYSLPLKLD